MNFPKLFHFNSTCEIAIANGSPYFNTSVLLNRFELDLTSIMGVFAKEGDYILSEEKPSTDFLEKMMQLGLSKVNYVSLSEIKQMQLHEKELIFNVQSWGGSPAENFYLRDIKKSEEQWDAQRTKIIERAFAVHLLEKGLRFDWNHSLIGSENVLNCSILRTVEEAEKYLEMHFPVVFKSPFSSSGRGLLVLRKPILNDANRKWITTILHQQGYIVASAWLEKIQDLSFQFEKIDACIRFEGVSYFNTNSNGQYKEHVLNGHSFSLEEGETTINNFFLEQIGEQIRQTLSQSELMTSFQGRFGVDALIYKEIGKLKVHPMVEINPRYTMGAVALSLQKIIHQEARGFYRMHAVGHESYQSFIEAKQLENPPVFVDGKLKSGVVSLTPFYQNAKFGAYLELF
ncbi:MAG: hypothetical protein ACK5IJ_03125 [Mangrovibacterium sp.]